MEVATQPAPLLLARGDDPLARGPQRLPQLHGVRGDRDVPREVVEEPQVTGRQRPADAAGTHLEVPDDRSGVHEGHPDAARRRRAPLV